MPPLSCFAFAAVSSVCVLEGTPYHGASAACRLRIKLSLFSPPARYGGDDADAECSDAPDHDAEHDAEGSAASSAHTARGSQLCPAPAHAAGNSTQPEGHPHPHQENPKNTQRAGRATGLWRTLPLRKDDRGRACPDAHLHLQATLSFCISLTLTNGINWREWGLRIG